MAPVCRRRPSKESGAPSRKKGTVSYAEQRRLFQLSPCHQFYVFRAGAGVQYVLHAPCQPAHLPRRRHRLPSLPERSEGPAVPAAVPAAHGPDGRPHQPGLQPRGGDAAGLPALRQPPDPGEHRLRICSGRHAGCRGPVVLLLYGGDDLRQVCLSLWPGHPGPQPGAEHDAAVRAQV